MAVVGLRLPDLAEEELLRELAQFAEDVPIVLNTRYASLESARIAVNIGAFAYVDNGPDPTELVRQVHRAVRVRLVNRAEALEGAVAERTRELQEANEALRRAQADLAQAQRIARIGNWEWDVRTGEVAWSDDTFRIFGFEPGEVELSYEVAKSVKHPEDVDRWANAVAGALESGDRYEIEYRAIRRDGNTIWVRNEAEIARDESGTAVRFFGTAQDITDRKRAEELLRESERRLSTLMDSLPGMAYRCLNLPDWPMEFLSSGCLQLAGYSSAELTGSEGLLYGHVIHSADRRSVWDAVQLCVERNQPYELEYRIQTREGQEKWVWERGRHVAVAKDGTGILEGFISDITARKQSEEALRLERNRAQSYLEIAGVMLIALDDKENVILINQKGCEILGISRQDILGKNWFDNFLPPEQRDEVKAVYERILAGDLALVEYYENPLVRPDGEERIVAWHNSPLRDGDGRIVGILSSGEDITERRRAEEALVETRQRLELALRSANVGLFDWNVISGEAFFSPEWKGQIGYRDDEVEGTYEGWEGRLHPDDRERVLQTLQAYLDGTAAEYAVEFRLRHKDGSYRWIFARGEVLRDESGQPTRMLGCHVDITEQREVEAQLRQSQKMEAVGQLAGGMAHDFRNQLTVIQGWACMLQEQLADNKDRRDMAGQILQAAERSATLTGQLLAFSRKEMLQPETADVAQLVFGLGKSLERVIREDIALRVVSGAVSCYANVDTAQFQQAIVNLAVNARDAMPDGGELTIETQLAELQQADVARIPESQPGHYVEVRVNDTGTGMDEETRLRVFEPFFTTKEVGKGTGLGLSMVYGFVRQSGGFVECHSRMGEGTRFSLYFPAVRRELRETEFEPKKTDVPIGTETILIVEDQDAVRQFLATMLNRLGYTVLEASDGPEALQRFDTHESPVDLLITDVIMPGMNGVELAKRLRSTQSDLAVLYVSGHAGEELLRRGVVESGGELLTKPYNSRQLGERVRQLLDAR